MNIPSRVSVNLSQSLAYNFRHIGICHIPGTTTAAEEQKRLNSKLFASLDDDTELMFGDDLEDY